MCFDTHLAQFLMFDFWDKRADIFMMIIAFVALTFTIIQLWISRRESRRTTAYSAYQEYLKLCFENHELSYGDESVIRNNKGEINPQYPWFISHMLFTFEQILETDKNDKEWKIAITSQLENHKWYLKKSDSVKRLEWNSKLRCILIDVLK
ncbi:hypothetical protein C0W52_09370 [Photobacterium kishitanii]|uniref:DUF4760 domain-containing protein n=1 Tax=Photobacterium kishitanii TaxID=318456 RepID=A0AAX0YY43_9GAMM|nr:hypothetical protein C0W70_00270 [Photobacterium kishitanii]PSX28421.1 hypothetical protein C0W52_09370 [Photobacterium kishitanii]PSX35871.1 hypothetical protein C0W39_00270 [Photobacterium kishitanii]PSX45506.1 hypothetical protein C0W53_07940 [Photobacterium kishitanii]